MREPSQKVNALSNVVIGAAIEVHRELGPGFLEAVYEQALCHELELRRVSFQRQAPIDVFYKGIQVGEGWIDILVENCLIVELKAVAELSPLYKAQVISYLKATRLTLGLLINFNVAVLSKGIQRIVLGQSEG